MINMEKQSMIIVPKTIEEALKSYRAGDPNHETTYYPDTIKLKGWTIINRISHTVEFVSHRKPSIKVKKRLNESSGKWDVWCTNGGIVIAEKEFAGRKEEKAIDYAKDLMEALS